MAGTAMTGFTHTQSFLRLPQNGGFWHGLPRASLYSLSPRSWHRQQLRGNFASVLFWLTVPCGAGNGFLLEVLMSFGGDLFRQFGAAAAYKLGFDDGKAGKSPHLVHSMGERTGPAYKQGHRDGTLARIADK